MCDLFPQSPTLAAAMAAASGADEEWGKRTVPRKLTAVEMAALTPRVTAKLQEVMGGEDDPVMTVRARHRARHCRPRPA